MSRPLLDRVEERRRARRVRATRALFLLGLLAWTSLASWWAFYFYRSLVQMREMTLRAYAAEAELLAIELEGVSAPGEFQLPRIFELSRLPLDEDAASYPHVYVPLPPAAPTHALVVSPSERERLRHESRTKIIMLAGEGTLLVGLLFACLVVMYRMLISEWRLNRQTESFVHAVTHELKSPIAGLRALFETFKSLQLGPEERAAYLELGLQEVRRLDGLVHDVLLSNRLEGDSFVAHPVPVDLEESLGRIAERRRLIARERGGDLVVKCAAPRALVDPGAFETIVGNLVDNALKYSPDAPHIRLETRRAGERVQVLVRDHGVGLSPEELSHVFQKFWRSETTAAKGTGLGLFIARELARVCRGELRVESEGPGKGSCFILELPA